MALAQIIDHAQRAVARLVLQFQESPLVKGMVTALANEIQTAEDGLWGLRATRDINLAASGVLDKIGLLVGAPNRGIKNDAAYRSRILTQILANKSGGSLGTIYAVAKQMIAPWNISGQPKIIEEPTGGYPLASYTIGPNPPGSIVNDDADAKELARILDDANPAGVRGIVLSQTIAANAAFSFFNGPGLGFGAGAFVAAYDGRQ